MFTVRVIINWKQDSRFGHSAANTTIKDLLFIICASNITGMIPLAEQDDGNKSIPGSTIPGGFILIVLFSENQYKRMA